jgi:competence protein ComEA
MNTRVVAFLLAVSLPRLAGATTKRELQGVVNLNTASPDELQLLSGVGPAKVRNILAYRTKHPFRTIEEVVRIKGIGRKMFRRLRLHLAINGPTTAQQIIRAAPDPSSTGPPEPPPEPPPFLRRPVPALPPRTIVQALARKSMLRPAAPPVVTRSPCLRGP